jgi:hypothetical protein
MNTKSNYIKILSSLGIIFLFEKIYKGIIITWIILSILYVMFLLLISFDKKEETMIDDSDF